MAFPATPLDTRVELNLGGTWTDVTAFCDGGPVQLGRGHPDESTTTSASTLTVPLRNDDGRFSALDPTGPYYGLLGRNTQIRESIPNDTNYLRLESDTTSSVTTPDKAGLQITGPIDIRVDIWPSDYSGNVLAAKWGVTAQSWAFLLNGTPSGGVLTPFHDVSTPGTGTLGFYWWDGASQQMLDSVLPIPYFSGRICLRVLFTPSTGTAQFFTAPTMAGPFTQLGLNQVFGATTLSAGVGQAVQVGGSLTLNVPPHAYAHTFSSALGWVYEAQILNNVTLEVDPVFSAQTAGVTSFTDSQSSLWTLNGTSEISSRLYRFHGEVPEWPQSWSPVSANVYVNATAGGLLRRLGRRQQPVNSSMKRAYTRLPASLGLVAYWPGEDGSSATSIASALGGPAMQITGTPNLASNSDFVCSAPLPSMNQATFTGNVTTPAGFTWTDNGIRCVIEIPAGGETDGSQIAAFTYAGGTVGYVTIIYNTAVGGEFTMNAYSAPGGTLLHSLVALGNLNGTKARYAFDLKKNGTGVDMTTASLVPGSIAASVSTFTLASSTIGQVTRVQFGGAGISGSVMGHFSVQGVVDTIFDIAGPLIAWNGEPAAARFGRLCSEEGIACRIKGPQAASVAMGNQTVQTLAGLLQECADADRGIWFETRQVTGWGYRTVRSLYNQAVAVPLTYNPDMLKWPLETTEDDQIINNDITATRPAGGSYRTIATSGPLSTPGPPQGAGVYDTTLSVNVAADSQLPNAAGWALHLGTVNEPRYPAINLDLTETGPISSVFWQILHADLGDRVQIATPPGWLPPGPIDQLIQDVQETHDTRQLDITWAGVPASPYTVAVAGSVGGHNSAKADTAGSKLTAAITNSAVSFQVTTTAGPVWTQAAADFPFDIVIDGERMTVSNITSATSPQTFAISARSVNGVVKAHLINAPVALFTKPIAGL